jgi:exodeoxyribonuclease VII small subunit
MANKDKEEAGKVEGLTYEQAMERLEAIVRRLEGGNLPLDEMLRLFEEGGAVGKVCQARLADAELRVERLVGDAGATERMPVEGDEDGDRG